MEIEQKESKEETLKRFGVYHVDGAEYNVYEDVFFKEIAKLEAENKALRDLLGEVRRTFGNDTMVVQILPERDSYYTPIWIKKIDQLLKNEG